MIAQSGERTAPAPRSPDVAPDPRFAEEVVAGLSARPRSVPSRWLYDRRGSRLFQRITRLPEYYLTRCEEEILAHRGGEVTRTLAGRPCTVVDLGAGDGHKTRLLLERLVAGGGPVSYAPVDLSVEALRSAARGVRGAGLPVRLRPVRAEWVEGLRHLQEAEGVRLALFLGSSIGNLERGDAAELLGSLRGALRPGDLALVGFDLVKARPLLQAAYDDAPGVTRAFNLNLLARINRELGGNLDATGFRHEARWDEQRPAMESWLVATRPQRIRAAGRTFALARGEPILTEISCKYREPEVSALARDAGFEEVAHLRDRRGWFLDALWRAGRSET